ncbi:MAG: hypothetical protein ACOH2T_18920 [Pseudomonas sp.]
MKLTLSEIELKEAVTRYVTGMITLAEGTDIEIEFKAGRGENGFTAEIDINYLSVTALPDIVVPAVRTERAIAETAKPQAVDADTAVPAPANLFADKAIKEEPAAETAEAETPPKTKTKTLFSN